MALTPSDVVAGLALVLSAYATWKTVQFNDRQRSLIESQELLNKRLLEKEDAEATEDKKADLGANFVKLGSTSYRLRIYNKGKSAGRNVRIEFPSGNDVVVTSDIDRKFPLESLEPLQSVDLMTAVHMGSKSKHEVKLLWEDDFSAANEKTLFPTL
jgi:hypothetical protein